MLQNYEKTSATQKKSSFFFSLPSAKDAKLVSFGLPKNFGEAKVRKVKRKKRKTIHLYK